MQEKLGKRDYQERTMRTIGLVTFSGVSGASIRPISNLIEILSALTHEQILLVTGNAVRVFENDMRVRFRVVNHHGGNNVISRILRYIKTQVKITRRVVESSHVDTWIFFMGGETLVIPMATAKLLQKRAIIVLPGSITTTMESIGDRLVIPVRILAMVARRLCERIVIYSPGLITEWNLEPYRHKILVAHEHFLDFNTLTVTAPLHDRPPLIGYIGRLSGEKGVQHFAQALPAILSDQQGFRVLIGGDGALKETIASSLQEEGLNAHVDLPGWISHDDLPRYLNQLRLLVLPSYTEGLPNIMLEAMACGTPVLATPVGAIPDVIIDGKTGFIMENNSPECIAENVIRALNSPDLEEIAEAGRRFVEENFTFERTVENWKEILQSIE
jgi:glycosyltransferase involved in cell wall biosynthesis